MGVDQCFVSRLLIGSIYFLWVSAVVLFGRFSVTIFQSQLRSRLHKTRFLAWWHSAWSVIYFLARILHVDPVVGRALHCQMYSFMLVVMVSLVRYLMRLSFELDGFSKVPTWLTVFFRGNTVLILVSFQMAFVMFLLYPLQWYEFFWNYFTLAFAWGTLTPCLFGVTKAFIILRRHANAVNTTLRRHSISVHSASSDSCSCSHNPARVSPSQAAYGKMLRILVMCYAGWLPIVYWWTWRMSGGRHLEPFDPFAPYTEEPPCQWPGNASLLFVSAITAYHITPLKHSQNTVRPGARGQGLHLFGVDPKRRRNSTSKVQNLAAFRGAFFSFRRSSAPGRLFESAPVPRRASFPNVLTVRTVASSATTNTTILNYSASPKSRLQAWRKAQEKRVRIEHAHARAHRHPSAAAAQRIDVRPRTEDRELGNSVNEPSSAVAALSVAARGESSANAPE